MIIVVCYKESAFKGKSVQSVQQLAIYSFAIPASVTVPYRE